MRAPVTVKSEPSEHNNTLDITVKSTKFIARKSKINKTEVTEKKIISKPEIQEQPAIHVSCVIFRSPQEKISTLQFKHKINLTSGVQSITILNWWRHLK
jgi:hypothetical protein